MKPILATVLLDPPTTLFAGAVISLVSTKLIRRDPEKQLRIAMLWAAGWSVWYGICVAWPFFKRPDWMLVYLVDAQNVSLVPAFALFMVALVVYGVCGALATGLAVSRGKLGFGVVLAVGAAIVLGATGLLTAGQYSVVGTFAQYVAHTAPKLTEDKEMMMGMNAMTIGIASFSLMLLGIKIVQIRKLK